MDASWAETGDRYMLKLFRDYVFHQVDDSGAPYIDMAHITQCLNKVGCCLGLLTLTLYILYDICAKSCCFVVAGCWFPGEDLPDVTRRAKRSGGVLQWTEAVRWERLLWAHAV